MADVLDTGGRHRLVRGWIISPAISTHPRPASTGPLALALGRPDRRDHPSYRTRSRESQNESTAKGTI
ncbi:hypothetical protein VC83_05184 [Pseudogymnoascus destructans]|uniref:Uncharacterized protein n=1 Tax=Pseudogymnoascus destructans TaxID=655981 RepID=A0A177A9N1_9PEZI|nr:uncharacterized protein VC83_05184 [Pseudogymnoascus destructans]OAF57893.1 hypothetical protein VC83_05184 [Pseudogymnoascus destructans]